MKSATEHSIRHGGFRKEAPEEKGRLRYLREILRAEGIRPRLRSGQRFLVAPRVEDRVVELAGMGPSDRVLEIGAGPGFLTEKLAQRSREVFAVEVDRRLCALLEKRLGHLANVRVIESDILGVDLGKLAASEKLRVVGNLPYAITTPILFYLLDRARLIENAVLMVQREVAERIKAAPGRRVYGILSIAVQWRALIEETVPVSRTSFWPPPRVDSCILSLRMRDEPPVAVRDESVFKGVVRAAFGKRRKTIANSLAMSGYCGLSKEVWEDLLGKAGIVATVRAEQLSLNEYARLADVVSRRVCDRQA